MITDLKHQLLHKANAYCSSRGISKARLATLVVNDGKFFDRIEHRGGGFTVATYEKFMLFFSEQKQMAEPSRPLRRPRIGGQ